MDDLIGFLGGEEAGLTVVLRTPIRRWPFRRARTPIPVATKHTVTPLLWQPPLPTNGNVTAVSVTNKNGRSLILVYDYASFWQVTTAPVVRNIFFLSLFFKHNIIIKNTR